MTPYLRPVRGLWRTLAVVVLAVLLIASPVSAAETLTLQDDSDTVKYWNRPISGQFALSPASGYIKFADIGDYPAVTTIYCKPVGLGDDGGNLYPAGSVLSGYPDSDSWAVNFYAGDTQNKIGTGQFSYNALYGPDGNRNGVQWWVDIDTWDITGYSGALNVYFRSADGNTKINGLRGWQSVNSTVNDNWPVYFAGYYTYGGKVYTSAISGDYIIRQSHHWVNEITISSNFVELQRTFSGVSNPSAFSINTDFTQFYDYSQNDVVTPYIGTGTWQVVAPSGKTFAGDLVATSSSGLVTVYVRDSQTGDLIPGAALSIMDGITGTTVVNETLSTGQKSYSLEKSPSLRYSAQATATNYSSFGSIQFGVGDDSISLVLWMYPDNPDIEEPDEGKTALYGYVLTQGSQQPIPG